VIFQEITSKTRNYRLPLFDQYTVYCLFNSILFSVYLDCVSTW